MTHVSDLPPEAPSDTPHVYRSFVDWYAEQRTDLIAKEARVAQVQDQNPNAPEENIFNFALGEVNGRKALLNSFAALLIAQTAFEVGDLERKLTEIGPGDETQTT